MGAKFRLLLLSSAFATATLGDQIPIASRISTSPLGHERVEVVGTAGAVPANADVFIVTVEVGNYAFVEASASGAFRAELFAPAGTTLYIKSDASKKLIRGQLQQSPLIDFHFDRLITIPGTMISVPVRASTGPEIPFGGAIVYKSVDTIAPASVSGSMSATTFAHGETLNVRVAVRLHGKGSSTTTPLFRAQLSLTPLTDSAGRAKLAQNSFCSTILTPTGLPIERSQFLYSTYRAAFQANLTTNGDVLEGSLSLGLPIHRDLPAAFYRPALFITFEGVEGVPVAGQPMTTFLDGAGRGSGSVLLPTIRVGEPKSSPRLPLALLMNDVEQAARGVTALEDRDYFSLSPRIAMASERLVLPRIDSRTGAVRRYNLEPFAPTLALTDRGSPPAAPLVPIRFPSGELRVTIHRPDGSTTTLGPAPFTQSLFNGPGRDGFSMEGGPYITDPLRLTTSDSRFDVEFPVEGVYRIEVSAAFDDTSGLRWSGGGTYEVEIARSLAIDPFHVPGTPLEVGNTLILGAHVIPPIAADVQFQVRFAPRSDRSRMVTRTFRARANRFGYANAGTFSADEPGEYRVDVYASAVDGGTRWAGTRTWGGVAAPPNSPLIAHGKRGIDDQRENRQQWFFRTQTGLSAGRGHVFIPFHSGDVMWMAEGDATTPTISFQAPDDVLSPIASYCCTGNQAELMRIGEIPLFARNRDHPLDVHLSEREPEVWSYAYRFVERPMVHVRELIAEESIAYWRFNDLYGRQYGSGWQGDLPNDFKFQFAGVVLRGMKLREPLYGIYGSLFVLVPQDDKEGGTRVFPPFQTNGGGPLFTLKGKPIDIFFHPTALRPGTVLEKYDLISPSGQLAPTLPGAVELTLLSPSGRERKVSARGNKIGYVYNRGEDFRVDESGVWSARVKASFDGTTSAGQITPPYPTGDVLGSRSGEFSFYVIDRDAPQLEVASMPRFVTPADQPITFRMNPPSGLTNVELHYTVTMPGFILDEGRSSALTYTYNAQNLHRDFPNLDLREPAGITGVDTITLSFLVSGTDNSGARKHFARVIVIQGEELLMPDQKASPPAPRRRRAV